MRLVPAGLATATALACAVAVAACGFGPGPPSSGIGALTVTRDYGSKTLVQATVNDPPASETVIRLLDSNADITTRYGGGFVQSINGLAGTGDSDWFFYVNGVESPVGSADVRVKGGDRIWWDYRNWSAAMSVPAVVGSWPEPFAQYSSENPKPVSFECLNVSTACQAARERLEAATTAAVTHGKPSGDSPRMLVGTWQKIRDDPAVNQLRDAAVFATFKGPTSAGWHLIGLDQSETPRRDFGSGAGLVAALGRPPTWIVTGSGATAVGRAASALTADSLRNHYAVAATGHGTVPLPIVRGAE